MGRSPSRSRRPPRSYRLDIYRMGYYQGNGARLITSILPSATLPQTQPACIKQSSTGLMDCGNWAVSASWTVPSTAVSGIYFAKLVRTDGTSGSSHIVFVVRNDASHSDLLYQTSDTTWQAYNDWGGNSLYDGTAPDGRAWKVSYNRPFNTRGDSAEDFVFNAEYPAVRWLEANGYDVSYFSEVDSDRSGALIKNHKVFLSVGHDEYWSGESARQRGGRPQRWRQPRVLQRQRDLLEDPVGEQHRRSQHHVSHAGVLQGDAGRGDPRSTGSAHVDRHLAGSRLRPADRRREAGERSLRHDLHGQRAAQRLDQGSGLVLEAAVLAKHKRGQPEPGCDEGHAGRNARLRVGRGPRQRLASGRRDRHVERYVQRLAGPPPGRRDEFRQRQRDPQSDPV